MAIPSREDIGEQGDRLVVDQPVIGKNVGIPKIDRLSPHIRTHAAGLTNKKNPGCDVPGMQAEFPEHV